MVVLELIGTASGRALRTKFRRFGAVTGRTKAEIVGTIGSSNAVASELPEGRSLIHWHAPGYDIALGFTPEDLCYGIELENSRLWG
jgi:hypothetical protein